ncbi:MAG: YbgA family protein [Aquificaceae bacterium]
MVRPKVVLSGCLNLEEVRYDGKIVRDELVLKLRKFCHVLSVCPEVSIGFGTPRNRIVLYKGYNTLRLFQPASGLDLTERMIEFSISFIKSLPNVDGFLLKSKSPSCGVSGTLVYEDKEVKCARLKGKGMFAMEIMKAFPLLPVEDERRLRDPKRREHFFTRLFSAANLRETIEKAESIKDLAEFHESYRLLLLVYSKEKFIKLERLIKRSGDLQSIKESYRRLFLSAIRRRPSPKKHEKALLYILDRCSLSSKDLKLFKNRLEMYRKGKASLCSLLKTIRALAFEDLIIKKQAYLNPFPEELCCA